MTTLTAMGSSAFDFPLKPLCSLFLLLGSIHPFRLIMAVQTVYLQGSAALACWASLVTFLASESASPTTAKTSYLGCHLTMCGCYEPGSIGVALGAIGSLAGRLLV